MRRSSRGFTLIEIAVAMAILGVGVVTLQQIYQGALRCRTAPRARAAPCSTRAPRWTLCSRRGRSPDTTSEETTREGFKTRILVRHATAADAPMLEGSVGGSDADDERQFGLESEQSLRYLEVEVTWSDGVGQKTYTLKSLRLATEEDEE
jgi:prepilin-type N-terminal cleavage/methylation domain-containing protein